MSPRSTSRRRHDDLTPASTPARFSAAALPPGASSGGSGREQHAWWLPKRFGRGLTAGIVGSILVVGVGASAVLLAQSERAADRQERTLTGRATRSLQGVSASLVASFSGASVIVSPDGVVEQEPFDTFASGVVGSTLFRVVASVDVVADADRAEFEAVIGKPISHVVDGSRRPSPTQPEYLAVRYVFPTSVTSTSVVGFDIGSEPVRAAAAASAQATGTIVFSAPIHTQPTGQLAFALIQPLYRPGLAISTPPERQAAFAGFVYGLAPAALMLSAVVDQLPDGAKVSITDDGQLLGETDPPPQGGSEVMVVQSSRSWNVIVDYHDADHTTAWLMLIATIALAVAVGVSLFRNVRQTTELRAAAMGVRNLGQLSERLAMADSRATVLEVIMQSAATTVGAITVAVAMPSDEPGKLLIHHADDRASSASPSPKFGGGHDVVTSIPSPTTDAWNTKNSVFVGDESAFRGLYADGAEDRRARGIGSSAAIPLRRPNGEMQGVLTWEWTDSNRFGDGMRSTLQATAEVCQQSMHRATLHEQRWNSASALTSLSQQLSVSRNVSQIAEAVVMLAPDAGAADFVGVGFLDESGSRFDLYHPAADGDRPTKTEFPINANGTLMAVLRRGQPIEFLDRSQIVQFPVLAELIQLPMERLVCIPLIDSESNLLGVIAFVFVHGSRRQTQPEAGRLETIADLTAQTVERAMLYLHEHELVVNLQRQTLADLPVVAHLDTAARYLPSSTTLGLGGDWYDVYVLEDGRVGVVVGDVSGHGIDAIADMTEFRTTISTLLRTNPELGMMPALATALLADDASDDVRFATAGLMILDLAAEQMAYVRAGHPPMLVRHPGGLVETLELGGSGPIGVTTEAVRVQTVQISPGTVVVAYTDGLIERREEAIDTGLTRLREALRDAEGSDASAIADTLVARCLGGRQTADDAALVVLVVG